MGIYIFNWDILKQYLLEDDADPTSENDFGNNIIPNPVSYTHLKLMGEYGFSLKQKKALRSYLERSNGNSYLQFRNILQLLYFFLYREMRCV